MAHSIRGYVFEETGVSYAQIVKRFGDPKQIASSYVEEMETEELTKELQVCGRAIRIILVSAMICIVLWAGVVSLAWLGLKDSDNGYFVVEITENNG